MAKIKLTKGELKRQRDGLKQYQHYLPTLQLKKQQLQMKILEAKRALQNKEEEFRSLMTSIHRWVGLLGDPQLSVFPPGKDEHDRTAGLKRWVLPEHVELETTNIAGANIPILKEVRYAQADYDLYTTPFWIDLAIPKLQEFISLLIEVAVFKKQIDLLERELRVTTQRVNLFEKIKIPECQENIRVIRIYLGDQQASAVGISKVAKKKIEVKEALAGAGV